MAKTVLAIMGVILMSCTRSASSDQPRACLPVLFSAVPSDALALVSGPRASQVLSYFDSTSALRKLDLGGLADSRAVLSLNYYTSLVPVLTIDAGRTDRELNPDFQSVAARAADLGFKTAARTLDGDRYSVHTLIICPSETVLGTVLRHIDEGASIADVPLFREACAAAEGAPSCVIARPSAAARLLPPSFLSELFPRRQLVSFAGGTAAWVVLAGQDGKYSLTPVSDGSGRNFSDFLASLESSSCQIGKILPTGTRYVLDYPIASVENFRQAVQAYKDANVSLGSYQDSLKALRRASGEDPLKWEKTLKIKEIAAVRTDSASVLLLRLPRKPKVSGMVDNPCRGFISALYGSAFDLCDESMAPFGKWLVYGSGADVQQFVSTAHQGIGTVSKCKMFCLTPRFSLTCTESGNTIEFR